VTEPSIVKGPMVKQDAQRIIYQVTLAKGLVLTNPGAFGDGEEAGPFWPGGPVVSEGGEVLTPPDRPA
jgi:hypothetical protein